MASFNFSYQNPLEDVYRYREIKNRVICSFTALHSRNLLEREYECCFTV